MDYEKSIDLSEIISLIIKKIWILLIIICLSTGLSAIYSFSIVAPVYETNTNIIIGRVDQDAYDKGDYANVDMYQKMVKTYCEIAVSKEVLKNTIEEQNLKIDEDELLSSISVLQKPDTQIMTIKMRGQDVKKIAEILNALTQNFISEAQRLFPGGSVLVMNWANTPKNAISPHHKLNIIFGFCFGLLLSLIVILILSYMDKTIKDEKDVEVYLALPVLGSIVKDNKL